MQACMEHLKNPHFAYPVVHIAGTNGKGQVGGKIAHALQTAGYKTGLYSSPHIISYEERIKVNGIKIPQKTVLQYYHDLQDFPQQMNFFEYSTAFAFRYFKEEKVDIAIIEAGIGGLYDSTNVVSPILSVITSIGIDHTDYLGDTLEAIAEQKAGIIKSKIPVILGPSALLSRIVKKAEKMSAPLHHVKEVSELYESENRFVAKKALSLLSSSFPLDSNAIQEGLNKTLPCRFEKRGNVIYDVAHNPDGVFRLIQALEYTYPNQKFRFLFGVNQEKDSLGCLKVIHCNATHIYLADAKNEPGKISEEWLKIAQMCASCPVSLEPSVKEGMQKAKAALDKKEILVVCGSFYMMSKLFPKGNYACS